MQVNKDIKGVLSGLGGWRILIFLIAALSVLNCVDEFSPNINEYDNLLVIDGSIIKGDSLQKITISRSSKVGNPQFIPVSGCNVKVVNTAGSQFSFEETSKGVYVTVIPQQFLSFNSEFQLKVTTPDKEEYESDFEPILESSPVDSIYYLIEPFKSSSVEHPEGFQFYTDLKAPENATKNYRWAVEETWEYHSPYRIRGYYDKKLDNIIEIKNPSDSLLKCWLTVPKKGLYSSSTENLSINEKKKIPINYVPGNSYKLSIKYSLLLKQYALSNKAYEYWNQNKIETSETGGLYQNQPSQSKSNIYNINDPDEIVLGFFWASSFTEKRIFFEGPFKKTYKPYKCGLQKFDLQMHGEKDITWLTKKSTMTGQMVWAKSEPVCFDCTLYGGKNIKPDFW